MSIGTAFCFSVVSAAVFIVAIHLYWFSHFLAEFKSVRVIVRGIRRSIAFAFIWLFYACRWTIAMFVSRLAIVMRLLGYDLFGFVQRRLYRLSRHGPMSESDIDDLQSRVQQHEIGDVRSWHRCTSG